MRRIITGLGAALLLLLLLVGLPVLLVLIWPVGLPHVQLTPAGIWSALLRPDDGTLFLTLIKVASWIVWALLLITITTEAVGRLQHISPIALPGLALPQGLARGLVAATIALFINTNTAIGQPPAINVAQAAPLTPAPAGMPEKPTDQHADGAAPRFERYTVKKGDILSQIALDHLGDAHRYPEIYKASRNIHQPGGARLDDPDVIDIGWKLNLPASHTKPADGLTKKHEPKRESDPPAATGGSKTTPPSSEAPAAPSSTQPSPTAAPVAPSAQVDSESAQPPWLLTGLTGAGAILAGSLWLVLLRRRSVQHHHRRPGFVTTPPPPHTLPVEKTLRYQGGPASDLLIFIDEALRRLALSFAASEEPLPVLLGIAATRSSVRVHLAEDATLPDPWQQADTASVWSLETIDVPGDIEPLEPDGPAPWPHLATVGADEAGRWWLINLEAAGITTIEGDPDYADDLARYLAAELATTPWSRDVQVDLIGSFPELTGIDSRRLRHHPSQDGLDDTIAVAVDTIDRLNRLHMDDLPAARAAQSGDEIWLNRVVVVTSGDVDHLGQLQRLIRDQANRTAVAVVLTGSTEAAAPGLAITVGSDGRASIPLLGLDLIANGITFDEARGCVQLLEAAEALGSVDLPKAGGDGWRQYVDQAGRLDVGFTAARDPEGSSDRTQTNLPQPDDLVLEKAATTSEDLRILAPTIPEPTRNMVAESDPTLDQDLEDWFSGSCARPRLSVLGPMRVRLGRGGEPTEAAKRKPYYTELVAYLATRPAGATSVELCAAFAATPARLQRDLGVVRKWLGSNPETGQQHLPDAVRSSVVNDGHGLYRLHELVCDADLFLRLRLRGQTRGTAGLNDYMRALSLITGTPYRHLREGGGIWLSNDRDDQHLLVAIVDTAHLAVTMALQVPDLRMARVAAEVAAAVAVDEEGPKLDLAAVADAEGDPTRIGQTIAKLLQERDVDGPVEPDSRTVGLIESRGWSRTQRTG